MIEITGQHLINGTWSNAGQQKFASANPSTDSNNPWTFFDANSQDVEQAVTAAADAFTEYRATTSTARAEFLEAIANEIEALGPQLVEAAMSESALPQMRIEGERGRTCGQLRLFANNLRNPISPVFIDNAQPERSPLPKADSRLMQIPLGPVAVFGASNFPLAFSTAGGDTASALAAGCPVVVKGHPAHPATTELVCHAINRAIAATEMPSGVFSMVQSTTPQIAQQLVQAPEIKAVGFTGSQKVGDILNKLAQERPNPIPFFGELGSINPQFVLPEILAQQATQIANNQVGSMLMGHGQFCTSPGVMIVENTAGTDELLTALEQAIIAAPTGTMLTRGICQTYQQQVAALKQKATLTHIGSGEEGQGLCQSAATLFRVSATDFIQDSSLQEEIFGPCALIVLCEDNAQMQQIAQSLHGQLTASIHGLEQEIIASSALIDNVSQHVGRLIFNQMPTGVEVCHSMQHGGPYPASTAPATTSVGSQAINRFTRPICLQNMPSSILPQSIAQNSNTPQIIV